MLFTFTKRLFERQNLVPVKITRSSKNKHKKP